MFAFEKFSVYILTEEFIVKIQPILKASSININIKNQLYRASSSILLNIAEGAGKYSKKDKKNFYSIARGSTQECVAILRLLKLENNIEESTYLSIYKNLETISKMLAGLINKMID